MSLNVNITGNQTGFQQVLQQAKTQAKHFKHEVESLPQQAAKSFTGAAFKGLATFFTFEGLKSSFEHFIGKASELREITEQVDLGAEATQKWVKAAGKLGLSYGGILNVLSMITAKRDEAMRSRGARDELRRLGFSNEQILDKNLSNNEFARMAMGFGLENRGAFQSAFGNRSAKYLKAAEVYDHVEADFDAEALETAHRAELATKRFSKFVDKLWGGILGGGYIRDLERYRDKHIGGHQPTAGNRVIADYYKDRIGKPDLEYDEVAAEEARKALEQEKSFNLQRTDALARQRAVERQTMTIGGRRQSILEELQRTKDELAALEKNNHIPLSIEELRKNELRMIELRSKKAGLIGELREAPMSFSADSMAKVGLYSANALQFNPVLNVQTEQLRQLQEINRKMGTPHRSPTSL